MVRSNRVKIIFVLVFFLGVFAPGQDKQVGESKQLIEEVLAVYKSKGKQGLRDFVKKKKDKIPHEFIVDFAKAGCKERKGEWLKVCEIMAEVKKNEKTLADVFYEIGEYFRLISDCKKANDYFDKAFTIYQQLNDLVGQGNIYLSRGDIYLRFGENPKALEMYDKAMRFYEKTGDPIGQGNVYLSKGNIYFYTGNDSKALEMFDKALPFFEKADYLLGQGNVYLREGDIHFSTGDNTKALEMYNKAVLFFEKTGEPLGQGNVYHSIGDIYFFTGNNSKAFEMYDKAMIFFEKARSLVGQGTVYARKGEIYFYKGDNIRAFEMYDKALLFFEKAGQPSNQGYIYRSKGDIYLNTGDNLKALALYDKALPFFEKAGEPIEQGKVHLSKGDIYFQTGEYSLALELYKKALLFFEKANDPLGIGNVYHGIGNIYCNRGDNSTALEMYDKALAYFERIEQPISLGGVYINKGHIYSRYGQNTKALEMYEKALSFFEKAEYPIGQGKAYHSMGEIYQSIDKNLKALEMYEKALSLFKRVKYVIGLGYVFESKGDIYLRLGDNLRALEMTNKAIPFFEKSGDIIGQANLYINRGDIYLDIGNNPKAMKMYDKALTLFEKLGHPLGQGSVYLNKGEVYFRNGDNSKALHMYKKALYFFENTDSISGQGHAYLALGEIYFFNKKYKKMIEAYNKALFLFEKTGNIDSESIALHGKAIVLTRLGKKDEAIHLFEKGIDKLEKMRSQTAFAKMKRSLMEKIYNQYEETVLFMLENKYDEKAFKYTESMKARVFLDRLAEGLVRLDKGLATDLKEKRDKLVAKLSLLSKEIHKTAGEKDKKKLQELKEQYRKVEDEFEELLIKIRLDNPLYAWVRYPQPASVQVLQRKVLKKGELLLRYFLSPHECYVFLVSKENFETITLKLKESEIKKIAKLYLQAVGDNSSREIKRYGKLLYKKLFQPVEQLLKGNRDIFIIPDGNLAKIPFESFIIDQTKSGDPVFLLEEYRVKYIQSASILSLLREYYRNRDTKSFIGFGDPVYDYEDFKQGKLTGPLKKENEIKEIHRSRLSRAGGVLDRLPGSGAEIKAIAGLFKRKSQKCTVCLREQSSEEKAKAPGLKGFDFIHFACHGLLNDDFQCLVLSQDIPGAKEDGYFTLNEIMNCDYNAKLVVLSGCETGSGKMYKGEGVTGLTRAVMYAGTPAVVASLWKVDDTATKELMVRFYKNMLEKDLDKIEALRQAKLEMIKNPKYRSPFFWSAFVMYGE